MPEIPDVPWKEGSLYGVLAYIVGLVFTGLWFFFDHVQTLIAARTTTQEAIGLAIALFYNAQSVRVDGTNYLISYGVIHDFLTPLVYQAIPIVVLFGIGALLVYSELDLSGRLDALVSGASIFVGYLALSLVVTVSLNFLLDVGFPLGRVALSGLAYPIVLGGVGGLVANEVKTYLES